MALTPEQVHTVAFDLPPLGHRGYAADQVDAFLDLVEAALAGQASLTVQDVRDVAFGRGGMFRNRGYDEAQVDAFLDSVVETLEARWS